MNGASRFAFLSFLDLISCAFGAAVLIFVVAATEDQSQNGSERSEMLVVYAKHIAGDQPEIGLKIERPDGVAFLTSDRLAMANLNARVFNSPSGAGGVLCLVIPKPTSGVWKVHLFRIDGLAGSEARFSLTAFCPSSKKDCYSDEVVLSEWNIFGLKPLNFEVLP